MEKRKYLVDTCILIGAFRGNEKAIKLLNTLKGQITISSITAMELFIGAKTAKRKNELAKHIKSLTIAHLTTEISSKALGLVRRYSTTKRSIAIPDCIIAATAIESSIPLVTYNKKDFEFISELELYNIGK